MLVHATLALCVASSWSVVPDYPIPLSNGSQTVEIPVNCSRSLPSEDLKFRFEFFEEDRECGWFVNGISYNSPLVISKTGTSIVIDVTTVCLEPIHVLCVINKNGNVISIKIKECIHFLLYTCKFHVHHMSFSYSSDI